MENVQNPLNRPEDTDNWYTVTHTTAKDIFKNPRKINDYSDVIGSSPKPHIDTTIPARSIDRVAPDPLPPKRLFAEPRELNKTVYEPRYSDKYPFIEQMREPSPRHRKLFINKNREDTKYFDTNKPQIDLNKPVRKQVGCQSPINSGRKLLFQKPRELHYDDVEGSHPRMSYDRSKQPRDYFNDTIPNNQKSLFVKPRDIINKYQDVAGSSSKNQINLSIPQRNIFMTVESENKRKLFQQPRDWVKLPSQSKKYRPLIIRKQEQIIEPPKRQLFVKPRETMKYSDVEGSHPALFYPRVTKKLSPTFASSEIF